MEYKYKTKGVCASSVTIKVDGAVVTSVEFDGGCNGNAKGLGKLVVGMPVADVVERLGGIRCDRKQTSCPDQLAKALTELMRTSETDRESDEAAAAP
ncbi:MAG: TIGR03905 family TSCPD domain-containing protein [Oscillospiraceae bacterium]|jgi:uncharacterized protein (TIGR03905 family)|nr:TIGR03905 family TSCPD domain-containing protein [Oscillospiraceae bacterium]